MKKSPPLNSRRTCCVGRQHGFSLAELLTAMAVTSLLMIALFSLLGQSSAHYHLSQRHINSLADGRALFHFLENDLASQVAGTTFFLQADANGQTQMAFVRQRDAAQTDATGDLMGCFYYIAFREDEARHGSPTLFRRILDAHATQQWMQAGNAAVLPSPDPLVDEPLAYHVLRWEIRGLQRDAQGRRQPWDSAPGSAPSDLEILVEMVDERTAQRFKTEQQWKDWANSQDPQKREAVRRQQHRIPLR